MIATVTSSGIPREELAKKISSWDLSGTLAYVIYYIERYINIA